MNWFHNTLGSAPGSSAPQRQLMIPRLIRTAISPFARDGNSNADNQKDVYKFGGGTAFNLAGGMPSWVPCDFVQLGASKTGRCKLPMPNNFTLLAYLASASQTAKGGFRVNVYDINRRLRLTERPVNFNLLAGTGSSPLFLGGTRDDDMSAQPYAFQPIDAQAMITIVNLETVPNNIEFVLYGVQGGN